MHLKLGNKESSEQINNSTGQENSGCLIKSAKFSKLLKSQFSYVNFYHYNGHIHFGLEFRGHTSRVLLLSILFGSKLEIDASYFILLKKSMILYLVECVTNSCNVSMQLLSKLFKIFYSSLETSSRFQVLGFVLTL